MGTFDHLNAGLSAVADLGELARALREYPHFFGPRIIGAEVTQAIQYFRSHRHLTDPLDRAPDNSARLVAYKPAWVRVYVRGSAHGSVQMTGKVKVERRGPGYLGLWQDGGELAPAAPGVVTAEVAPDYADERGTLSSTLNFVLPSDMVRGLMRLTITVWAAGQTADSPIDSDVLNIDATLLQTLSVRGLMVAYNGPNAAGTMTLNIPAPTVADLQATAAWTHTTNPVQSEGVFSSAGTVTLTTPLTGAATTPGGCSTGWFTLNALLAAAKANDGNRSDVIYYGLLPNGVPMGPVIGCASDGVTSGSINDGVTMAHEIGHFAGQAHAPCGTPGDANYPAYEPYDPAGTPQASLGEYGLDINSGTIHRPTQKDYMSYCSPRWISLYTHARLIDNAVFSPTSTHSPLRIPELVDPWLWPWEYIPDPPPPPWWFWRDHLQVYQPRPVIVITGTHRRDRSVAVESVMRLDAQPTVHRGQSTDMVAELIGRDGNVVASAPVMRLPAHAHGGGCGCACGHDGGPDGEASDYSFQALVPNVEPGAALRIQRPGRDGAGQDSVAWERKASETPPRLLRVDVKARKADVLVQWSVEPGSGELPLQFSVQFSKDGGRSWNGCAAGLRDPRLAVDLAALPSGSITFRAMVHDGFNTVAERSRPVVLKPRAPGVTIMNPPADGSALLEGSPLRLWVAVATASGKRIEPDACAWTLDGEPVGSGLELWITAPKAGYHQCGVTVRDVVPLTVGRRFMTWDGVEYPGPDTGEPTRGKGEGGRRGK
jgi:hypothetical protein